MYNPVISVVTVCYNAVKVIEDTILSVLNQTYKNIEYIIIDGASSDGTVELLNRYSSRFSYMVSEKDKGIYDAMNKAIDIAKGEWILFLNAGDVFANDKALFDVFQTDGLHKYSVIYGDTIMKASWGNFIVKGEFFSSNDAHLPFCHQSALAKTVLMQQYKFDLRYKIVADYNFFYNLYSLGHQFFHVDNLISVYDTEGFSAQRVLEAYKEVATINGTVHSFKYYKNLSVLYIRKLMLEILPNRFINHIRKNRRETIA